MACGVQDLGGCRLIICAAELITSAMVWELFSKVIGLIRNAGLGWHGHPRKGPEGLARMFQTADRMKDEGRRATDENNGLRPSSIAFSSIVAGRRYLDMYCLIPLMYPILKGRVLIHSNYDL